MKAGFVSARTSCPFGIEDKLILQPIDRPPDALLGKIPRVWLVLADKAQRSWEPAGAGSAKIGNLGETERLCPFRIEDKLIFCQRDNITDCMNKGGDTLAGFPHTLSELAASQARRRPLGQKPRSWEPAGAGSAERRYISRVNKRGINPPHP